MINRIFIMSGEENSSWLKAAIEALQTVGKVEVRSVCSPIAALKAERPDLIILDASSIQKDLHMDLAEFVRSSRQILPQPPLIIITSSPTWDHARDVFRAGARDYLRKSFDMDQLLGSCNEALHCKGRSP